MANALLLELQPERRAVWTERAHAIGETWLGAGLVRYDADDLVSANEAAEIVHVRPGTIRMWASRGRLNGQRLDRTVVYRVGDVLDAAAQQMR